MMFFSRDTELKRRIEIASKGQRPSNGRFPLLHDPIEDDEVTAQLIRAAQAKADGSIDPKIKIGRCHWVWNCMKRLLKEEHGIVWYSPRDMNPGVKFD